MNTDNNENILLRREDRLIVPEKHSRDAYFVLSGEVTVFATKLKKNGTPDRWVYVCDLGPDSAIPAFFYRDRDQTIWTFLLTAQKDAELEIAEGKKTDYMEELFFEAAGLTTYHKEGFERGLIDFYRKQELQNKIFVEEGEAGKPATDGDSIGVIWKAFEGNERIIANSPLYAAAAYACRAASIPILEERCFSGREMNIREIARLSCFACREVVLNPDWYRSDCGPIIGTLDGEPVACVPKGQSGYLLYKGKTGETEKVTKQLAEKIEPRAFSIGKTLPGKALRLKDLIKFALESVRASDVSVVVVLGLVGAWIGILLPTLNQKIYDDYIPLGNYSQLIQLCVVIASFMLGNLFFDIVKRLTDFRIGSRVGYSLQNAVYYRVFHLPETFFRGYDSADLAQRLSYVDDLANKIVTTLFVSGLATVFSLLYLFRMFKYSPKLAWIALALLLLYAAAALLLSISTIKYDRKIENCKGSASAKLYQFLSGIEKLRMAGAEDKAAYEYLLPFSEKQTVEIRRNRVQALSETLSGVASVLFSMVFYFIIVKNKLNISTGSFMAFNSAFGAFSATVLQFIGGVAGLWQLRSQYDRFRPIIETPQENEGERDLISSLDGNVSLKGVRFSYSKDGPNVLDGIDLEIKPREYIGIVGASGCGKSTLLKLLLGFEKPDSGHVLYNGGKDLESLDKRELRKNLGVVLQNGKLISGSIFENITITAPHATMKDVNEVIEAVGLKDDIAQMPMGIHTMLSENSGTISGGQQQRILIARAIIGKPSILIFDEATSALDNLTQAAVTESLDRMNVTRIVVAHRLSTIRKCDRIIVLDKGRIAEEGDYNSLMSMHGLFYDLAIRQIADEV